MVLAHLIRGGRFGLDSVLLAEKRIEKLGPLLAGAPADTPVYIAAQPVLDGIAGFPMHRGVLGVGRRPPPRTLGEALAAVPKRALVVALFGIANHDNMGGVFRNAAAFGAELIVLDQSCCDPLYRKAIRVSVGAALTVPFVRAEAEGGTISLLKAAGFSVFALSPGGNIPLIAARRSPRTAVLLGAEGPGLSPEVLAEAERVRIPTAPAVDSLNVAVSAALALHHFAFLAIERDSD